MRPLLLALLLLAVPAPAHAEDRADRLEDVYGVGDIRDGTARWSDAELRIVEASLKRLSAGELRGIKGVELVRMRRSPRIFGTGLYKVDADGPRILIYDRAFKGPGRGSSKTPNHTLLHEFGHAIAHKAVRVATRQAERSMAKANALVAKYNDAVRSYNALARSYNATRDRKTKDELAIVNRRVSRLSHDAAEERERYRKLARKARLLHADHRSPFPTQGVLRDYKIALGLKLGPTRYGRVNLQESFAESFLLHHVDPKTLKKRLPKVHRWLAGEGHLNPTR